MTVPKRSLRLVAEDFTDISALTGEKGELIYDVTNATIRLNDGTTQGGIPLATRNWVMANVASGGIMIIDGGSATG
jgi:hypothetical protein